MDEHEQSEVLAELARHHHDFAKISSVIDNLSSEDWAALKVNHPRANLVLRQIRLIVG